MSWLWGSSKKKEENGDDFDSSYESYFTDDSYDDESDGDEHEEEDDVGSGIKDNNNNKKNNKNNKNTADTMDDEEFEQLIKEGKGDELLDSGIIPSVVVKDDQQRTRVPSAVSLEEVHDDNDNEEVEDSADSDSDSSSSTEESHHSEEVYTTEEEGEELYEDYEEEEEEKEAEKHDKQEVLKETTDDVKIINNENNNKDGTGIHNENNKNEDKDKDKDKDADDKKDDKEEEEEEVTTLAEKQSLLVLAAEHDRVDILQAILNEKDSKDEKERKFLLNPINDDDEDEDDGEEKTIATVATIPPLHIAVSYGSVNAVNCLMRMGADPSLRPNVTYIKQQQQEQNNDTAAIVDIPHIQNFHMKTAWDLAYSSSNDNNSSKSGSSRWSFSASSSSLGSGSQRGGSNVPPSKREGIKHAFTAEALRCIGSDEYQRLHQLLSAGMPHDTEIGNKSLLEWCFDMSATHCQNVLQTYNNKNDNDSNENDANTQDKSQQQKSKVLDRPKKGDGQDDNLTGYSISDLHNRLDELEQLSIGLSKILDNVAEEVSVCAGLLLVGSGASALATHVRSLKNKYERKLQELERLEEAYENSQDELEYWIKVCGGEVAVQEDLQRIQHTTTKNTSFKKNNKNNNKNEQQHEQEQTSGSPTKEEQDGNNNNNNEHNIEIEKQQLRGQISVIENKIRMLRASIADLSEENARNLVEVNKRGLNGAIQMVRRLREDIRDIEYEISICNSNDVTNKIKINILQNKYKLIEKQNQQNQNNNENKPSQQQAPVTTTIEDRQQHQQQNTGQDVVEEEEEYYYEDNTIPESEKIATGKSRALVIRQDSQNGNGFHLPFNIWQLLLRIIGIQQSTNTATTTNRSNSSIMNSPTSGNSISTGASQAMII